ncbi:hypothetical protein A3K63_03060 [Candidatus Micrarchaeota archaeon RBG_16_49_10]|nr:MAG: hypothetical protein A3K63_03060 [Candidatus Micrarchaeota archaeon RBG_16_49_10]
MVKNDIQPLKFYQEPIYYSGLLTIISGVFVAFSFTKNNINSAIQMAFSISTIILGVLTYFFWETRCPNCKRSFLKKEKIDWIEDLGTKKQPYTYYSKIYQYPDGTTEDVEGSKKTIMRDKKYDRHYYICKKCDYGADKEWNQEKGEWLGEEPKPLMIKKKENLVSFGINDDSDKQGKTRTPIPIKIKKRIFERAENACQHCGNSNVKLHIHHIDKNPENNNLSNLIVLCPDCHSIAESLTTVALKNESKKAYRKVQTIHKYTQIQKQE